MNGVILIASGNLIRAGFSDFLNDGSFDPATDSYRTDVPEPPLVYRAGTAGQFHRWDGDEWVLVSQPQDAPVGIATETLRDKGAAGKLLRRTVWATDNGDGTYADRVEETLYTYGTKKQKNTLLSRAITTYFADGSVRSTKTIGYFTVSSGGVVEKEI